MGNLWQKEVFKFILKFSELNNELDDYVVSVDQRISDIGSVVVGLNFDFKSSLSSPSVLFTLQPSDNQLTIYDTAGLLNPLNTSSPYYGYMCQGLKVLAYISPYEEDAEDYVWSVYGVWYVSHWKGGMQNGAVTAVTISCEELLSEIAAFNLTNTEYSGSTAAQALTAILTAAGLASTDYVVDSNLDLDFPYTQLGQNVAQTINDILTLARGYCTIKHNGTITFTSLAQAASYAETYNVGNTLGALTQSMTTAVNYSRVVVKYSNGSNSQLVKAISNSATVVQNGTNTIKLVVPKGTLSIEAVRVKLSGCTGNDSLDSISYVLSGNELTVIISTTLQTYRTAHIDVYATSPTSEATNEFTEDGCLILTDIMGGSATNVSIEIMKSRNDVYVVTGVNLPMLLEAINSRESNSLKDLANQVSNSGTRSIINLKEYFEKRAKR